MTGENTAGIYLLIENYNPPGVSIPLHLHRNEDETFYVVRVKLTFKLTVRLRGEALARRFFCCATLRTPLLLLGSEPAKMLMMLMPAGLEKYFEELSQLPTDEPLNMEKVIEISAVYGIEFLLPPDNAPMV